MLKPSEMLLLTELVYCHMTHLNSLTEPTSKTDKWLLVTDRQMPSRSSPVIVGSNSMPFGRTCK